MNESLPLNTFIAIAGMTFLLIAVIGRSKLGFAEINPGCFGRILALIIGLSLLSGTSLLAAFPTDTLIQFVRNILTDGIQAVQNYSGS
ncbi:MAG: hypothetical protein CLLPBCKN_006009 [Chroococcidiopsis cubana SAG 39.79]|uniref:Uncharacterized protein n=1 Tax=Chroococcidiopsis cubana SAG 39.79 TaxID=388085 RepID=A0AB37UGW2_9CYAN|nr:hypothetical protein [Chroococcidiopsis cubana]MDZ4876574.1 hypothetical protein [Chroococcidiopsis cubana SAG 39.79]PSB56111.1 hypothetical protein C7B79_32590 [Chroococcidiopsis cubana CCALA 043]RUT10364.1 hypothetical protein DSM107010_43600 [Chroococcidiopsis cubana SAG 39.79]